MYTYLQICNRQQKYTFISWNKMHQAAQKCHVCMKTASVILLTIVLGHCTLGIQMYVFPCSNSLDWDPSWDSAKTQPVHNNVTILPTVTNPTTNGMQLKSAKFWENKLISCIIFWFRKFHLLNNVFIQGRKEMLYLTTHSTHFIYCYMASDLW